MAKFYFTYGTNPEFPYQGGWTEIEAENSSRAQIAFRYFHPNREGSPYLNCAGMYDDQAFAATIMSGIKNCFGHACREQITVSIDAEKFFSEDKTILIVEHVSYSRSIIDDT